VREGEAKEEEEEEELEAAAALLEAIRIGEVWTGGWLRRF